MYWFYYLTTREKVLSILSLIAILFVVWLYFIDSFTKEKQWYIEQINHHSKSVAHYENTKNDIVINTEYQHFGYVLNALKESLLDAPKLQFLSADITEKKSATIKLKGSLIDVAQYLLMFNKKYPGFYWDSIGYQLVDVDGVLELKIKFDIPENDLL